jgi:predicted dehydrogenase
MRGKNVLRWGILSTAHIARKNWKAIKLSGNSTVTAVASRDVERSRRFIAECQAAAPMSPAPQAFGSYEELLASKAVDAVYIPLPTGLRKEWMLRAAAAGKHVVCEKPCAVSVADLQEMLEACRKHQVQFMDGVMFMHSRRLALMRQVLDDGESVGQIKRITSAFSFCAPKEFFASNIRANSELEPQGCLGDLGWYCIRLALWAMNWQLPHSVSGRLLAQFGGGGDQRAVPTEFAGELSFADGVTASFYCSFLTDNQQWANLSGNRGYLQVPDFVLPWAGSRLSFMVHKVQFNVDGCDFRLDPQARRYSVAEHSHSHATAQEAGLFRNFARQIRSGQLNEAWPEAALKTQQVMCACLDSALSQGQMISIVGPL